MTITQMVEVPENRRVFFDLPPEIPVGRTKVELTLTPEMLPLDKPANPLASLFGIDKGLDTMDAYFDRKRADKAKENAQFERMRQQP